MNTPLGIALVLILGLAGAAKAQQKCPVPPALAPTTENNIFTAQQEVDLGDVEAEQFEKNFDAVPAHSR